ERVINKALERDRDRRYADCREMHADLEKYLLSSQQSVSALQLGQLVEKYRPAHGKAEEGSSPALATPARGGRVAKTPEPFRAERTPAGSDSVRVSKPLARTGTGGDPDGTVLVKETGGDPEGTLLVGRESGGGGEEPDEPAVTSQETVRRAPRPRPVEKTEMTPPPRDLLAMRGPAVSRRSREQLPVRQVNVGTRGSRSSTPIVVAILGGLALLGAAIAFLRPAQTVQDPPPPPPVEQPAAPVGSAVAPAPVKPAPVPEPEPAPAVASPSAESEAEVPKQPVKPLSPFVELEVRSDPPAKIAVLVGGKPKGNLRQGVMIARIPPGPVEIEVTGTGDHRFVKRESLTLEPLPKRQQHTVVLGKGTLKVNTFPASHVKIDGAARGDTPLTEQLYEGTHRVELECDRANPKCPAGDAGKFARDVNVETGKTTDIKRPWL
ncbi:MAG TPA: hypothetical protein VFB81_18825, partial [Myxococcales bacterium]|nr:hypothetical protein [Myxococcales bacterium]